ncbi:PREDICTED: WD repeat-containing protein 60-like [Priapulus caudatus]|uniref:WD repeat-containing protein 60-like n=1 Tax=Priapulus caudatus TaxID=37621 RepID=A0ABM1E1M8_PRICU|nr:PREDICTED: WD repeat-containing protein 60-like [Priapulus caudatus]
MPHGKIKSKEDTWKEDELRKSLKTSKEKAGGKNKDQHRKATDKKSSSDKDKDGHGKRLSSKEPTKSKDDGTHKQRSKDVKDAEKSSTKSKHRADDKYKKETKHKEESRSSRSRDKSKHRDDDSKRRERKKDQAESNHTEPLLMRSRTFEIEKEETGESSGKEAKTEEKTKKRRDGDEGKDFNKERKERDREKRHRNETEEERRIRHEKRKESRREEKEDEENRKRKEEELEKANLVKTLAEKVAAGKQEEDDEENGYDQYEDDFEDYDDDFEQDDDEEEEDESDPDETAESSVPSSIAQRVLQKSGSAKSSASNSSIQQGMEDDYRSRVTQNSPKTNESDGNRPTSKRMFINFSSAKQREMSKRMANKQWQRAMELSKLIEMDFVAYNIFEMPPIKEYDMYMRTFGSMDTKQAYVQSEEIATEVETQTEEIDVIERWTQHPADGVVSSGTSNTANDDIRLQAKQEPYDAIGLGRFLQNVVGVVSILLDENFHDESSSAVVQSNLSFSEKSIVMAQLPILKGLSIVHCTFSTMQSNLFLTTHSSAGVDAETTAPGFVCVWNVAEPSMPYRLLACKAPPLCSCFSPYKANMVFVGLIDGSLVVYDLDEPSSMHTNSRLAENSLPIRHSTYTTAALEDDSHHSSVRALLAVTSPSESLADSEADLRAGLSYQLASLEEHGVLCLWVVVELQRSTLLDFDPGRSPGGRVKLVKSSVINLLSLLRDQSIGLQTLDMRLLPSNPNHFYIVCDRGFVIHGLKYGGKAVPRLHGSVDETSTGAEATCIDFSPFDPSYFLSQYLCECEE